MALLLRLRDDALLQCICRVPFVAHDAVRCVCRRLRDLAARDRLRRARCAAGWEENAPVVAGGIRNRQDESEEFEDCDNEDYRDVFALLSAAGGAWRPRAGARLLGRYSLESDGRISPDRLKGCRSTG